MIRHNIRANMITQLIRHEAERLVAYLDDEGILTIGVGHNCKDRPISGVDAVGDSINRETSRRLLMGDIDTAEYDMLARWPWLVTLDDARYGVWLNMCFNMGGKRLASFKKALAHLQAGNYQRCADEMLDSDWAKQVHMHGPDTAEARRRGRPGRAWELAEQMRTGLWQGV